MRMFQIKSLKNRKKHMNTMSRIPALKQILSLLIVLMAVSFTSMAAVPDNSQIGRALESISYAALPGNRVEIRLGLSKQAPQPLTFTIDNPARLALDLPATASQLQHKTTKVDVGTVQSVTAVEVKGRTRVVVNLLKTVPYTTRVEGSDIVVTLGEGAGAQAPAAAPLPALPSASKAAHRVVGIDFRRNKEGAGVVLVTLSDPGVDVDVNERGNKIIVDFKGAAIKQELQRRLDVVDFATPVLSIDAFRRGDGARMEIEAKGKHEYLAYQSDKQFAVEVKPMSKAALAEQQRKIGYKGERLSLNFQKIEVRAVLQLIADFTNLNLVASDTVGGQITLRLKNVPWDQALDIILKSKGLDMRRSGNIIMVAPAEELAAREKEALSARKQIAELAPLHSELIEVNYAKAADIAALLKAKGSSFLSSRGNVAIDDRTNSLLVQDTSENLDEIRKLVDRLDVPIRQVLIESRIVIATDDFTRELGVRFGVNRDTSQLQTPTQNGDQAIVSGSLEAADSLRNNLSPSTANRLNVDLPVVSPSGSLAVSLAKLPFGTLIDLELSAMQAENRGEVISTPRVITSNQKEALIEQGVEIPYQEASSSGATSVSFKKAVLSLKVKPQITPDEHIIMDLHVNKDSVGQVYFGVPSIDTREVSTQVLVRNGETVVLGGIYEQTRANEADKVPFFADLPVVGHLFRQDRKTNNKEELLIFITPKLLRDNLTM